MTPKTMDRACTMFNTMITKHADDLREAHFDWQILEVYDGRTNEVIQVPVPWVSLYWR